MKMRFVSASAAVLVAAMAGPAMAMDTIVINPLTAEWVNVVGGVNVSTNDGMVGSTYVANVSWGNPVPAGGQNSGYTFTSEALPISKDFTAVGTEIFKIGEFNHRNFPIGVGNGIDTVQLRLTYGVTIDGVDFGQNFSTLYDFDHWETGNQANPCADGGANGVGVNSGGCADQVTFMVNQAFSDRFTVGNRSFQLEIGGFSVGGQLVNEFWTVEGQNNVAQLFGSVSVVPEPASWAMLIAGFGLVGATMRRRRQQGVHVVA